MSVHAGERSSPRWRSCDHFRAASRFPGFAAAVNDATSASGRAAAHAAAHDLHRHPRPSGFGRFFQHGANVGSTAKLVRRQNSHRYWGALARNGISVVWPGGVLNAGECGSCRLLASCLRLDQLVGDIRRADRACRYQIIHCPSQFFQAWCRCAPSASALVRAWFWWKA